MVGQGLTGDLGWAKSGLRVLMGPILGLRLEGILLGVGFIACAPFG